MIILMLARGQGWAGEARRKGRGRRGGSSILISGES